MITKVFKTAHLNSVVDYVYREDKDPIVVDSTCIDDERKGALAELRQSIKRRPEIKEPVFHAVISAHKHDKLDLEQWGEIAQTYMNRMGFEGCRYVAVKHHDTDHDHIHIVASRIRHDRSLVPDSHDHYRTQVVARHLEAKHELTPVACGWEKHSRQQDQSQWHQHQRTGQRSAKTHIEQAIRRRLEQGKQWTMGDFAHDLQRDGIKIIPRFKQDKVVGLAYAHEGVHIAGSKVHRAYGWYRLQDHVHYDAKRDLGALKGEPRRPVIQNPVAPAPQVTPPPNKPSVGPSVNKPIADALSKATWSGGYGVWAKSLRAQDVEPVPRVTQEDKQKVIGMYFEHQGKLVPGSQVHRQYGWKSLQDRLGTHPNMGAFQVGYVAGSGKVALEPKGLECDAITPVKTSPMLKNYTLDKPAVVARHQGQVLSMAQTLSMQPDWKQYGKGDSSRRMSVMPRGVATSEGQWHLLVDRDHKVLVVGQSSLLEQSRGQDVVVRFDRVGKPVEMTPVWHDKLKEDRVLGRFTQTGQPYLDAKNKHRLLRADEVIEMQNRAGGKWQVGMVNAASDHQRVMEVDLKVAQGRMTLLVDAQKRVTMVPHSPALDAHRGKMIDVSKQRRQLPSLEQWRAQVAQKDSRRIDVIGPEQKHKGRLRNEEAHLKEGRFMMLEKANADVVLIPYQKRLEAYKGKQVQLAQDDRGRIEVIVKTRDRGMER